MTFHGHHSRLFYSSPDSFLWGYLKGRVCLNKPNTLQEMKYNIIEEISLINSAVLEPVSENTAKRMRICFIMMGSKCAFFSLYFRLHISKRPDLVWDFSSSCPRSFHSDLLLLYISDIWWNLKTKLY